MIRARIKPLDERMPGMCLIDVRSASVQIRPQPFARNTGRTLDLDNALRRDALPRLDALVVDAEGTAQSPHATSRLDSNSNHLPVVGHGRNLHQKPTPGKITDGS